MESIEVIDLDLEVDHLGLSAGLLRPGRRLEPRVRLEVESDAARGIAHVDPILAVAGSDLPTKQTAVEVR